MRPITIREYQEILYIEDYFTTLQKARLNTYRIEELLQHIDKKGYDSEEGFDEISSLKEKVVNKYKNLEQNYLSPDEEDYYSAEEIETTLRHLKLSDLVTSIHEYALLNKELEEGILHIQEWLLDKLNSQVDYLQGMIFFDKSTYANFLANEKHSGLFERLNTVSTEWDKKVTYIIKSKNNGLQKAINNLDKNITTFKLRDNNYQIEKNYSEIHRYEAIVSDLAMHSTSLIEKLEVEKSNKLKHKLNIMVLILTIFTVLFGFIQTYISIASNIELFKFISNIYNWFTNLH